MPKISIALTNTCNLNCKYCFAQNITKENPLFLKPEEYKTLLDFALTATDDIGIAGGEPTINPWFREIAELTLNDPRVKNVAFFSNGINAEKYTDIFLHDKAHLLLNVNSDEDIGSENFKRIDSFLEKIYPELPKENIVDKVALGLNLYDNDLDYNFIFPLLKKYSMKNLRVSITTKINEPELEIFDYFKSRKDYLFKFLQDCSKNGIFPHPDCNVMPICLWTNSEVEYLRNHGLYAFLRNSVCLFPVITLLPDKTAVNCFALDSISKVPLYKFKDAHELMNYYNIHINAYNFSSYTNETCKKCRNRINGLCSMGCPSMRLKSIKQFMDLENNLKL